MGDTADRNPDANESGPSEPDATDDSIDRFDLAGREIAELLRNSNKATKRLQAETERQTWALLEGAKVEAEAAVAARLAVAEKQAEDTRAEATRHLQAAEQANADAVAWLDQIADSRSAAVRMLDEVLGSLDRAVEEIAQLEARAITTRDELAAAREAMAVAPRPDTAPTEGRPAPLASSTAPDEGPAEPAEPAESAPTNGHKVELTPPPTTASTFGVTEVVRSAVQKAVAQRRSSDERDAG